MEHMKEKKPEYIQKHVRILKEDADKLEIEMKRLRISATDYIRRALRHFLICKNVHNGPLGMQQICVTEPGPCVKCGVLVELGEEAMYGKGVGLLCVRCYEKVNRKALGFERKIVSTLAR